MCFSARKNNSNFENAKIRRQFRKIVFNNFYFKPIELRIKKENPAKLPGFLFILLLM